MSYYTRLDIQETLSSKVEQIKVLTKRVLYQIPMTLGEFTDHGVIHSDDIQDIFLNFYETNPQYTLTEQEKYLISLAIWTHDIGNLVDRDTHEEKTVEILKENPFFSFIKELIGPDAFINLLHLIESHRGRFDLQKYDIEYKVQDSVRTKLLCALFRLMDDSDITAKRNSEIVYSIMEKYMDMSAKSKEHWEAHRSIPTLVYSKNKILIKVEDFDAAKILLDKLERTLKDVNKVFNEYGFPNFTIDFI